MSTVLKKHNGSMGVPPANKPQDAKQLRRDRWTAAIVVAVMIGVMALIVWLASISGGTLPDGVDYWPMMP